jgi:16S rRNA (uracil1498-N3)-methyltransferase
MGRRRLFVPPERLSATPIIVSGDEHHHIARVLRARPGDAITLFDGAGGEVAARIVRVGRDETELAADAPVASAGVGTPLVLLTAVPRGGRMDFLVQKCSELGVSRIAPVITDRSVVRPDPGKRARWEKIAREAARQCGRADVPQVSAAVALATALAAPDLPERRLVLSTDGAGQVLRALLAGPAPSALLIGPEGGFTAAEIEAARAARFVPVSLGSRILRVETAAIVAVALAEEALGGLSPAEG